MLAGLPKAPSTYSPVEHPEAARARRSLVLRRMVEEGYLGREEMEQAARAPLDVGGGFRESSRASFFIEHVRRYLEETYGTDLLYRGGLRVYTTLDLGLQEAAERVVDRWRPRGRPAPRVPIPAGAGRPLPAGRPGRLDSGAERLAAEDRGRTGPSGGRAVDR